MAGVLSPQVKADLQAILKQDQNKVGVNTIFGQAMDKLKAEKIAYPLRNVNCNQFFVHKKNRAGLGLSWHNAHRNGSRVASVGADVGQLGNAVAIELPPDGPARSEQIAFNMKLIERSKRLLAEPSGYERFLTLGCGHTAAFCKAAQAQCPTPQVDLQDSYGNIDVGKLRRDVVFAGMIDCGWDWWIVPHIVDKEVPAFADTAQKALNASNHVASLVGEVEVAKTIADCISDCQDGSVDQAIATVRAMGAPCAEYASHIAVFVSKYAGGNGAPLVHFLDAVAKQFQCNVTLGETYWAAVANAAFPTKTNKFPLIRAALICANLTAPKIDDGIAKLLVKGDVQRLTAKALLKDVEKANMLLEQCGKISQALTAAGTLKQDAEVGPTGRFWVRIMLKLTNKEKSGREKVVYTTEQICAKFLGEMSDATGSKVAYSSWDIDDKMVDANSSADHGVAEDAGRAATVSLEQHKDAVWLAQEAGYAIGANVYERQFGYQPRGLYKIQNVSNIMVELVKFCEYEGKSDVVKVELDSFMKEWSIFSGDGPFRMEGSESRTQQLKIDKVRADVYNAMYQLDVVQELAFYRRPDEVHATVKYAKNALVLCPIAPMNNISAKKTSTSVSIGTHDKVELFCIPPQKPPIVASPKDACQECVCAAFWWVGVTDDESAANMVEAVRRHDGVGVHVLVNSRVIDARTRLVRFKQAVKKVALSNVVAVVASEVPVKCVSNKRRKA